MSVFFNGRLWVTPVSASLLDDSGMFNKNISVGNVLAIVGRSEGGEPFKALRFGSASEARAALVGDEITIKAIEKAFDPSAETTGPSQVVFVRINPATQAALVLKDDSAAAVINLVSTDYGRRNNGIKVKVESGSISGKKLTTQFGNSYFSADNIARDAFDLTYTGVGLAATATINGTSVVLKVAAVTVADIALEDYATIQPLVDRINATAGFVANVLDGNGEKATLFGLDFAAAQDVKTAPFTATAHLQACIDWLNGAGEGYVTATRAIDAGAAPANMPFAYLAGASDGIVTNAEWQLAYDVLQQEDVQWVVPLSGLPAIHAMNDSHLAYMSNIGLKERRGICGAVTGMSDSDAKLAAKSLNSDRTSLTHLGIYDYSPAGKLTLYPAYVAAALMAGMFAGVNPGTALTNKSVKIRGIERKLRNPTDTDLLILGGILCIEDTPQGFKVVKSISTWLSSSNYNRVEQSVGVACDFVVRNVRDAVDGVRGKKGNPLTMAEALSRAKTRLEELSRPEPMGPGVLAGDAENPPFRKLSVSLEGDVLRLEYEISPVIPCNYILSVVHAVPYSGKASA